PAGRHRPGWPTPRTWPSRATRGRTRPCSTSTATRWTAGARSAAGERAPERSASAADDLAEAVDVLGHLGAAGVPDGAGQPTDGAPKPTSGQSATRPRPGVIIIQVCLWM